MAFDVNNINGREPLVDYPWRTEVDNLLYWLIDQDSHIQAFCFDLVMSAAYVDATSGLEKNYEYSYVIEEIYKSFEEIAYEVTHRELMAADYGTPLS